MIYKKDYGFKPAESKEDDHVKPLTLPGQVGLILAGMVLMGFYGAITYLWLFGY